MNYLDNSPAWKRKHLQDPSYDPDKIQAKTIKYTEAELYALNKKEQIKIIDSFGDYSIPMLEKGRVNLILKLQLQY